MIKLADTLAPMADFPAVEAKDVAFNDNKSLQEKYDNGELGGGSGSGEENKIDSISVNGTPISPDENKNVDITVPSIEGLTKDEDLATVAKSGDYEDLINKPTIPSLDDYAKTSEIPSKVSDLENDSNYLSSIPEEYVTDTELEAKGYLTEHQDISGKVDKVEGKSLIADTEIERLASVDNYDDTDIRAELANKADITAIPTVDVTKSYVDTELAKKADTDHTHTTVNGHTVESDVPVDAKFTDTVYDDTEIKAEIAKKADATSIPSKVSVLENDSKYQTESDVTTTLTDYATKTYVGEQIANAEHLKREIVTVLPSDTEASDNIIYMLKVESATGNDKYQEYMKIDGTVQMVGDTSVDLTDYAKSVDIPTTVAELTDSSSYAKTTDIPTTLPANGGNADTVNNHTVKSDVPENAVFTDTVYDDTELKGKVEELSSNLGELCNKKIYCGEVMGTIVNGLISTSNPIGKVGNVIATIKYANDNPRGYSVTAQTTLAELNFYFRWHRESDDAEAYPPDGTEITISYMIFY